MRSECRATRDVVSAAPDLHGVEWRVYPLVPHSVAVIISAVKEARHAS